MDASAEPGGFTVLFEILDIQVFDTDRRIGIHIPPGEFVEEIFLLVGDMVICLLQVILRLHPVLSEPLLPGNTLLQLLDRIP